MAEFNADDLLQNLSGLELMQVAQWLKDNNWWDVKTHNYTVREQMFHGALDKLKQNRHRLTMEQESHIIVLAELM